MNFTEMRQRRKSASFSISNEATTRQSTRSWVPSAVRCFDETSPARIKDGNVHPSISLTGGSSKVAECTDAVGLPLNSLVPSTTTYATDENTTVTRTIIAASDSPRSPKLCAYFAVHTPVSCLLSPSSPTVFKTARTILSVKSSPNLKMHYTKQPPPTPAPTPVSESVSEDAKTNLHRNTPTNSSLTLDLNEAVPQSPPSPRHFIPQSAETDICTLGFARLIRPPPNIVIVVTKEQRVIDET
jgi:hypothetical protein